MCRFIAYSGKETLMDELVFKSENSLVSQSKKAKFRTNPLNGDGFGIGWYPSHQDEIPGTFVSIEPAWSNRNLIQLTQKILTRHFFAHIRDASPGMPVSQSNCHPFQYGRYLWMHNGRLDKFPLFRRMLMAELSQQAFDIVKGNTDSEHAFALFLDEINFNDNAPLADIETAMLTTIRKIADYRHKAGAHTNAYINFAVTNGEHSAFTRIATLPEVRPATLYYQHTDDHIIVSSEPLSAIEDGWREIPPNSLITVSGNQIRCRSI